LKLASDSNSPEEIYSTDLLARKVLVLFNYQANDSTILNRDHYIAIAEEFLFEEAMYLSQYYAIN
jgi:hypothetical protein